MKFASSQSPISSQPSSPTDEISLRRFSTFSLLTPEPIYSKNELPDLKIEQSDLKINQNNTKIEKNDPKIDQIDLKQDQIDPKFEIIELNITSTKDDFIKTNFNHKNDSIKLNFDRIESENHLIEPKIDQNEIRGSKIDPKENIEETEIKIYRIETKIDPIESKSDCTDSNESRIYNYESKTDFLDEIVPKIDQNETKFDSNRTKINPIESKIDPNDSKIDHKESKIDFIDEIVPIESKIDRIETKFESISTEIDRIDTKIITNDSKIDQIESKIDPNDSKIDLKESKIDFIDEIVPIESEIDRIENKFDSISTQIDRIETKIDTNDSKIDRFGSKIDSKNECWYRYSASIENIIYSVEINHLTRNFTAEDLIGFNNTGNVCVWPSEESLAYYALKNIKFFSGKNILELGAGMSALAGIFVAKYGDPKKVLLTDGNELAVKNISKSLEKNNFDCNVSCCVLKWGKTKVFGNFDVILSADCLFFDEARIDLVNTIYDFLSENGIAFVMAPNRGGTLEIFAEAAKNKGFFCEKLIFYDINIWERHLEFLNNFEYEKDIHYPILLKLSKSRQ